MTPAPESATRTYRPIARAGNLLAIVLGVLAVFVAPVLTGLVAIVLGIVGYARDRRLGRWALPIAILGTVIGAIVYYGVRGNDFLSWT